MTVKLHGFTAVASTDSSAKPAEAEVLVSAFAKATADTRHIHPRVNTRGFLRRRVKKQYPIIISHKKP